MKIRSDTANIVEISKFIQATRDAGYKSIGAALAELIDNSIEAGASRIEISFEQSDELLSSVTLVDNGSGMNKSLLRSSLQFGGSTRFDSRSGTGRFGMGLPNSSLSQARRVDVYSWEKSGDVWSTYLDIDEIIDQRRVTIPVPRRSRKWKSASSPTGTIVKWSKCDRISFKSKKRIVEKSRATLGRIFRNHIWNGCQIHLDGRKIEAVDPLLLRTSILDKSASLYGSPLVYEIEFIDNKGFQRRSPVEVRFVCLPLEEWASLSNEQKRSFGISKGAGVSIVRAEREIDFGWYFMGKKRKENYDDWWRCQVAFRPELDDLFGVTNTKQGIRPSEFLKAILVPDIERIAHTLNSDVRKRYSAFKNSYGGRPATAHATKRDVFLSPPTERKTKSSRLASETYRRIPWSYSSNPVSGLTYRIVPEVLDQKSFFVPILDASELVVVLNKEHPFFECVYLPIVQSSTKEAKNLLKQFELMILAAARAECKLSRQSTINTLKQLREEWSRTLAMFLD